MPVLKVLFAGDNQDGKLSLMDTEMLHSLLRGIWQPRRIRGSFKIDILLLQVPGSDISVNDQLVCCCQTEV